MKQSKMTEKQASITDLKEQIAKKRNEEGQQVMEAINKLLQESGFSLTAKVTLMGNSIIPEIILVEAQN